MQSGMAKQPPQSDEDIANAAMQDIYTNVTSAKRMMRDYDMRYVLQRIIRAIREAKSVPQAFCSKNERHCLGNLRDEEPMIKNIEGNACYCPPLSSIPTVEALGM